MGKLTAYTISILGIVLWLFCVVVGAYPHNVPTALGIAVAILLFPSCLMLRYVLSLSFSREIYERNNNLANSSRNDIRLLNMLNGEVL
jgi:hypothetical protein